MTSQVTHTLPDDVLLAYSTGQLPAAFDLVVASHVSLSDDSRARLETFDAVGGAVLESGDVVEMSEGSLDATLNMLTASDWQPVRPPLREAQSVFPAPLHDFIGGDLSAVRWRSIGMGAKQSILHEDDSGSVRLLSIPAGAQMPDHGHCGLEMTLVLKGAFRDEFGEFHRGDIELADEDVEHTPTVIGNEVCICLAATDNRLRFNGLIPRLAQQFLRI